MGIFYNDSELSYEENQKMNKWKVFQMFISELTLDEIKLIRRHIIAIEKALFLKGGVK